MDNENQTYKFAIMYNNEEHGLGEGLSYDVYSNDLQLLKQHLIADMVDTYNYTAEDIVFNDEDDVILVLHDDDLWAVIERDVVYDPPLVLSWTSIDQTDYLLNAIQECTNELKSILSEEDTHPLSTTEINMTKVKLTHQVNYNGWVAQVDGGPYIGEEDSRVSKALAYLCDVTGKCEDDTGYTGITFVDDLTCAEVNTVQRLLQETFPSVKVEYEFDET